MLKPSENANDLFRRMNTVSFELRVKLDKTEKLQFGDVVELQAGASEMTEV